MEIRDYLRVARRRWMLILTCLAIAVGLAAVVTVRATPQYSSTAQLFISTPGSDTSQAYQGGLFSQQRVASYADLVASRTLAEQVLNEVDSQLTSEQLSAKVASNAVPETVILEISVSDANAGIAQEFTQAYAEAMTRFITELESPSGGGAAPIKATIAEDASVPSSPYAPQPLRNLGLAAILGLLLGLGVAVLREVLDTTIKSNEDVLSVTAIPVMGTITHDPNAAKTPLITEISTHAPRAEAFRVLRTNLQFVDVDHSDKVFTVTSAVPSEGKTSTATNLAIALAQAGEKILLIEGDLRRPKIDSKLGLEHAVGLTTVLVGRLDVAAAIQRHSTSGLDVLTSGSVPPNPAELLQSRAMTDLLKSLRGTYDTIILDAPPLLPVTDAALLASHSDGALIVVRHGRTTRDQLASSIQRLEAVDARCLGIVINATPLRGSGRSGYGYGYGYGEAPVSSPNPPNSSALAHRDEK